MGKQRQKKFAPFLAIVMLTTIMPASSSFALTTQERLEQAEAELRQNQQNLEETRDNLSELEGQRNGLQEELNGLNGELNEVRARLETIEAAIEDTTAEIERTREELAEAMEIERQQYESMKERIRFMYENRDATYLEMLFGAESFADFLNKTEYIQQIENYDRRKLTEYMETCQRIEAEEERLTTELEQLEELRQLAQEEQDRVDALVASTAGRIANYADQISDTEQQMLDYEARIAQGNNDVEALRAQLEEERRLAALAAASHKRDISEIQFAEGDRYLLANLIYCEAGGEPYAGKLAVGAVVMNRMLSSVFPDTMVGVIYAPRQFSPVASGRLALALAENRATESCYQAADEAMSGVTNVEDCVFFRTPIDGITPRFRISGHIFY